MVSNNESPFYETQQRLSETEQNSTNLALLVQAEKNKVENAAQEREKAINEKKEASTHLEKLDLELSDFETDKARLLLENHKSSEDISFLNRQLTLLDAAVIDIEKRLVEEGNAYAKDLHSLNQRMESYLQYSTPSPS